jgi:hypothetical protein
MTDYGDWYTWFLSEELQANGASWRDNITRVLYHESTQSFDYPRLADPGGENEIVMIMSGHLNSILKVDNTESVEALFGQPWSSQAHTLSNAKEIYRMLLAYFRMHLDKMFVVVTAPPISRYYPSAGLTEALNARAFNVWLTKEWLAEAEPNWEHKNVFVFDLFNVLSDNDNHHRVEAGQVLHTAAYGDPWIAWPYSRDIIANTLSREGVEKATEEFGPVLNVYWHRWREWLNRD